MRALQLRGRVQWLLTPSSVMGAVGAFFAALTATFSIRFPDGITRTFAGVVAAVLVVLTAVAVAWLRGRLPTLAKVERGAAPLDDRTALAICREVRAFPGRVAAQSFVLWVLAVVVIAVLLSLMAGTSFGFGARLVLVGLVFGVLSTGLSYLLVARRARAVIEQVASAVDVELVVRGVQGGRRRLRPIIVGFVAVASLLPSALLVDLARSSSRAAMDRVAEAPRGAERDEVAATVRTEFLARTAAFLGIIGAFVVATALLTGRVLADPLRRVAEEATRMAKGELPRPRVIGAEAEGWAVTAAFTAMHARMYSAVSQLQAAGARIGATTSQLLGTSTRYESGSAEQAASLNETSATTEELAQSAKQISQSAQAVTDIAQRTLDAVLAGQQATEEFTRAVERMRQDHRAITDAVVRLQKRVQQIGRIVEFINTVADRSDLLALSAELEGTKAGDIGRGFTLVASEMRRLAENVIESTNEIEELIGEIRDATEGTVTATEAGLQRTESGIALSTEVTHALAVVVDMARRTSDAVRAITLATQQQQSGTDQLAEAMAEILSVTQRGLQATRQLASANQELTGLARDLDGLVGHFRLEPR